MKVPEGRPTIAHRFNGGFRSSKPIESRRDEREDGFVSAISAAPPVLSRFVFTPTVKTVGYFLSSRRDLICAALEGNISATAVITKQQNNHETTRTAD